MNLSLFWYAEVISTSSFILSTAIFDKFDGSAYNLIVLFNDEVSGDEYKNECISCVESPWFIFLDSSTFILISFPTWCKISWLICRESVASLRGVDDDAKCLHFLALMLVCFSSPSTLSRLLFIFWIGVIATGSDNLWGIYILLP